MARRIVFARPDGSISVVVPDDRGRRDGESVAVWLARLAARWVPAGTPFKVVEHTELPGRTFRDAWRKDAAAAIVVDLPLARGVHLARIRAARDRELVRLDRDWMRATGRGEAAAAAVIEANRQVLRDLPQTANLDQFTTASDLDAYWPAGLGERVA